VVCADVAEFLTCREGEISLSCTWSIVKHAGRNRGND